MNAILFIVVVALWSMEAWNLRNKKFTIYLPAFKIKKTRNKYSKPIDMSKPRTVPDVLRNRDTGLYKDVI